MRMTSGTHPRSAAPTIAVASGVLAGHLRIGQRCVAALAPLVWLLLVAGLLTGCENGHTVVVQLQTDLTPGLEFDQVRVQARGARARPVSVRDDYGRPVQLTELRGVASGSDVTVEVALQLHGRDLVARRVRRRVTRDQIMVIVITRNCIEIACPPPAEPDATECRNAVCVAPDCEDDGSCAPSECVRDSDCRSSVACVTPRCALGICLATPDPSLCADSEICSPIEGCVPIASVPDAGLPDAGLPDASEPDASEPDAPPAAPTFALIHLPAGGTSWSTVTTTGFLPRDRIEAAFAPPGTGDIVVITTTEVLVFSVASRTFVDRQGRDSVFPDVAGVDIGGAYAANGSVVLSRRDNNWVYAWSHATRTATLTATIPETALGPEWSGPLAPPRWRIHAMGTIPNNASGWATPAASSPCGTTPIGPHALFLTTDGFGPGAMTVAIFDSACGQFVQRDLYARETYAPFRMPGAPSDPFSIKTVDWVDGLWAFTTP